MSWPTDGLPRFVVSSVTGFPGTENIGGSAREFTLHSVCDRGYCHAEVWRESSLARGAKRGPVYALTLAARLEAEHAQP